MDDNKRLPKRKRRPGGLPAPIGVPERSESLGVSGPPTMATQADGQKEPRPVADEDCRRTFLTCTELMLKSVSNETDEPNNRRENVRVLIQAVFTLAGDIGLKVEDVGRLKQPWNQDDYAGRLIQYFQSLSKLDSGPSRLVQDVWKTKILPVFNAALEAGKAGRVLSVMEKKTLKIIQQAWEMEDDETAVEEGVRDQEAAPGQPPVELGRCEPATGEPDQGSTAGDKPPITPRKRSARERWKDFSGVDFPVKLWPVKFRGPAFCRRGADLIFDRLMTKSLNGNWAVLGSEYIDQKLGKGGRLRNYSDFRPRLKQAWRIVAGRHAGSLKGYELPF
jgi:hypothetical protein